MHWALCAILTAAQPAAEPPSFAAVTERLRAAHRAGPVSESLVVTVTPPGGRARISRVLVRVDAATPRVSLRLGRALRLDASGREIRVVTPQNPALYFTAELSAGVSAAALDAAFPAVPAPQIAWAVGGEITRPGDELLVVPFGWVRVNSIAENDGLTELTGATAAGAAAITLSNTGRLARASGFLGGPGHATQVQIACEPGTLADSAWAIDITGRARVASLAELIPAAGRAAPGDPAPALSLMDPDRAAWSLADALRRVDENPVEAGPGPIVTCLVLYRAGGGGEDAALLAAGTLRAVKKDFDRRRLAGDNALARVLIVPVAVFEIAEFHPASIKDEAQFWQAAGETMTLTTGGRALLNQFAPAAAAAVVMLDAEQTILAVVPVEGAALDGLVEETRGVLREASGR